MRGIHWPIVLTLVAITAQSCGGDGQSPTAPGQPSQQPGSTQTFPFIVAAFPSDPPSPGAFGDGTYRVNADIKPGRYFTRGTSEDCEYGRKSNAPPPDDLIGGKIFAAGGQWIVDVQPTDAWFQTFDCGLWSTTPNGGLQSQFGAGMWLVGSQVAPGRYRSNGSPGAACTWSRLADLRNTIYSANAQGMTPAGVPVSVTIAPDDVAFESHNCSAWTSVP